MLKLASLLAPVLFMLGHPASLPAQVGGPPILKVIQIRPIFSTDCQTLRKNLWNKQVEIANAVFQQAGIHFSSAQPAPSQNTALVNVDGKKLVTLKNWAFQSQGVITVFFVNAMTPRPPEPGSGELLNRDRARPSGLIIMTNELGPDTLAHELGEVLLPASLKEPDAVSNLMCHRPGRRVVNVVDDCINSAGRLTPEQVESVRATARRF